MSILELSQPGAWVQALCAKGGLSVYPCSVAACGDAWLFVARQGSRRRLGLLAPSRETYGLALTPHPCGSQPAATIRQQVWWLSLGDMSHANACAVRALLPFTAPVCVGLHKSVGLGDRLGLATPGHIRALRQVAEPGVADAGAEVAAMMPIFAQQSIREMERTERTPEQVLDAATWGVLQEGWRAGYGADADHLKSEQDIDLCVAAGFVLFTLDPREHVDNAAETDDLATLREKFAQLPWERLQSNPATTCAAYQGKSWTLGGEVVGFSEERLLRAAGKYGRAIAHLARLHAYLAERMAGRPWELEVSVDETETPTRPEEHFYLASELKRLGVTWVSLAPRFVGRFEKGVDYIGDLAGFEADFARHVAIARALGPYKLSLHSGSDKFSIYSVAARLAGELVHLKTAGTSYLAALSAVAHVEPALFRRILRFALEHYEQDRVSYHVSAEMGRAPDPAALADADLAGALEQFDARQALHVTFGSVLNARDEQGGWLFREEMFMALDEHEEAHYAALQAHLAKHIAPFVN